MSDAEWAVVRDAMPVPGWLEGRGGQPESYCHRQMVDAVRYLVAGGITWRAMPADFPAWDRVYAFFRRWRDKGLTAEFHDRLRDRVREAAGRTWSRPQLSSTRSPSREPHRCLPRPGASTAGRRSTAASATSWWTPWDCYWP
ncbi:transposase [Streptomyces sp. IBSBF 2394]|uniref:transposase n=1 Tax=Streptomyces sp. IBSBF 2394 TaxID=2903532 RepID=UPI002FDBB0EF